MYIYMKKILDLKCVLSLLWIVAFMVTSNSASAQNYIFDEDMDAITIKAKKSKSYQKVGRREKEELIELFKKRLKEDFPNIEQGFEVESDYVLYQDTMVMTKGYLKGRFVEMPKASAKKKDSLAIIKHKLDEYINPRIADNMKELEEGEEILSDREAFSQQVHRMLWGISPYKLLGMIEELNGKWDYIPQSNTTAYITFRGHKGFMGIYRVEWKVNFLVERSCMSLLQLLERVDLKVSIPFGVKLDEETVANINKFNIAYDQFDALKFRKGWIEFKRYVEYNGDGNISGGSSDKKAAVCKPISKSVDMNLHMEAKKREPVVLKALCNMEIQ